MYSENALIFRLVRKMIFNTNFFVKYSNKAISPIKADQDSSSPILQTNQRAPIDLETCLMEKQYITVLFLHDLSTWFQNFCSILASSHKNFSIQMTIYFSWTSLMSTIKFALIPFTHISLFCFNQLLSRTFVKTSPKVSQP